MVVSLFVLVEPKELVSEIEVDVVLPLFFEPLLVGDQDLEHKDLVVVLQTLVVFLYKQVN